MKGYNKMKEMKFVTRVTDVVYKILRFQMPITASERQKKYMEKLKSENPEKYEEKRKKHLEKVKARQKKVAELKNEKNKRR